MIGRLYTNNMPVVLSAVGAADCSQKSQTIRIECQPAQQRHTRIQYTKQNHALVRIHFINMMFSSAKQ